MVDSETIAHFCAVTDAPASTAEHYLSISNGDLDTAVTLFFEGGGTTEQTRRAPLTRDEGNAPASMPVTIISSSSEDTEDEPFVPVVERGRVIGAMDVDASAASASSGSASRFSRLRSWFTAPVETNDSNPFGFSSVPASAAPSERGRRLADLFRQPLAIIDPGNSFATARSHARSRGRYLIFSLHDTTDFASQAANRDWWNDELVQRFVQDRLVFVQAGVGGVEAQRYCSFYPLDEASGGEKELWFPHVAVIDPRTGERVLILSEYASIPVPGRQVLDAAGLIALLTAFISDHPLPIADPKQSYVDAAEKKARIDGEDASESSSITKASNAPDAPAALNAPDAHNAPIVSSTTSVSVAAPEESVQLPPEPEASAPNTILIQFRFPDGRRLRRRFSLTDTTAHLYRIVRLLLSSTDLALITHEGSIPDSETATLQTANLGNVLVTVVI